MEQAQIEAALSTVKGEIAEKARKFTQAIDLIIVTKPPRAKTDVKIDTVTNLPRATSVIKTCAFIDKDMSTQAGGVFDKTILKDEFGKYDKKAIKKLIKTYNFFFSEASVMAPAAAKFGKQLTAANKMPNPKTNTIIGPASDLKGIVAKVRSLVKLSTKKNNAVCVKVGDQNWNNQDISKNILFVYSAVKSALPNGDSSIKHVYIKPTMGKKVAL